MKKIMIMVLLMIGVSVAQAQSQYHIFNVKGKYGITDTLGNEAIKPVHAFEESFPERNELALYNFDDKIKDIIFNLSTGTKQVFESIDPNAVYIQKTGYTFITDKGKKYLRSEESDKVIPVKDSYYDFSNEGKYIIAKYTPPLPAPEKPVKDKNGFLMPPKPILMPDARSTGFAVLENNESMKPLLKGVFEKYIPLYAVKKEEDDTELVKVEIIKLAPGNWEKSDFYTLVFSTGNTHSVYNSRLVLVKKFELKNAEPEDLAAKASAIMKTTLSTFDVDHAAPPSVGMVAMSRDAGTPKIVYPFFTDQKAENGMNQFVLKESETITKIIFETRKSFRFDKYRHSIRLIEDKDKDSVFSIDPETGALYLPQKYWDVLGLIVK
ncbi:hypothetical protein DBR32_11210 [Taibaiella sp. KBW10]|uniref:hypothetical protein n=1 Tax=Taibaiella sp. KBW10 TaxID=2153357 RepID=UPI000F59BD13|nr:hypothetical protein [Taibaiella sp. KBW10]RQO30146.1 hypothetical protein DBR32_11210 [Taibaiella sp. KBW10]